MRAPPMLSGWLLVRALSGFSISSSKALIRGPPLRTAQQRGPSNSPPFGLRNAQYLTAANLPLHAPNSIRKVFASLFRKVSQSQGRTCMVALPKFVSLTLCFVVVRRCRIRTRSAPSRGLQQLCRAVIAFASFAIAFSPPHSRRIAPAVFSSNNSPRVINCSLAVARSASSHVRQTGKSSQTFAHRLAHSRRSLDSPARCL